ncbi:MULTISPECIES: hypothetical protein [unclassified Novosphingobium]|uniref:hypothetical protein n=1 Tax=unclassified Novosphingobium TaxID=2644732 RepID=UPI00146AE864|nr:MULTISPECIES: hypothetical protein [unclassified Novosphingobium]NMN07511.1 hypothetical protein [Novosphingobium sp. SG919]NMN89802.1 hypothetical protein [Novosphingobium sp. SG916]
MDSFIAVFDANFPQADVEEIGHRLLALDCLVPGFVPPAAGLLDLRALAYAEHVDELDTVVLVDRNLASRMAQLASEGALRKWDKPTEVAINLMAFAQAMNFDIEPGLAFHELAHRGGNGTAQKELSWFRAADRGAATKWIDVAMRRTQTINLGPVATLESHDMAAPLKRWNRNYIAMLKIADLALRGGRALSSILSLLDWMIDDFILAGPAFMYAARYFGPRAASGKMLKSLWAPDREKAILGVRNAAWDVTYVSEFGRLSGLRDAKKRQYIFATADHALWEIAVTPFCGPEPTEDFPALVGKLELWWPPQDARKIHDRYFECVEHVRGGRNRGADLPGDPIGDMIAAGEAWLRNPLTKA